MTDGWHTIGAQRVRVDGDVILSQWFGACTLDEMNDFLTFAEQALAAMSLPFLMIDNTHAAPAVPKVRERLFSWARSHRIQGGVVIFGATAATRVIGMLILNALSLLRKDDSARRIVFVRDEAAARAFIAQRRAELARR